MFSRRDRRRFNRGRVRVGRESASAAAVEVTIDPLTDPTELPGVIAWNRADLGVTGTGASLELADQSGNGNDLVVANGSSATTTLTQGGLDAISLDGVDDVLGYASSLNAAYVMLVVEVLAAPSATHDLLGGAASYDTSNVIADGLTCADAITVGCTLVIEFVEGEGVFCNGYQLTESSGSIADLAFQYIGGRAGFSNFSNVAVAEVVVSSQAQNAGWRRALRRGYWWPRYVLIDTEMATVFALDSHADNSSNTDARKHGMWTEGDYQYVSYTNEQDRQILCRRDLTGDATSWELVATGFTPTGAASDGTPTYSTSAFDNHNFVQLALDGDGYVHMTGGTHTKPSRWVRGASPGDMALGTPSGPVETGATDEDNTSYCELYRFADGDLLLSYRNGASGNGSTIFKLWDTATETWSVIYSPLINGEGARSPYMYGYTVDSLGRLHVAFSWRETGDSSTAHDICYMMSDDKGTTWYQDPEGNTSQTVPVTTSNHSVIAAIPQGEGLQERHSTCVDENDDPMILGMWANEPTGVPSYDSHYHVLHWNGTTWDDHEIPHPPGGGGNWSGSDGSTKGTIVHRSGETMVFVRNADVTGVWCARSKDLTNWYWQQVYTGSVGSWGSAMLDERRWAADGQVSLFTQVAQNTTSPPRYAGLVEPVDVRDLTALAIQLGFVLLLDVTDEANYTINGSNVYTALQNAITSTALTVTGAPVHGAASFNSGPGATFDGAADGFVGNEAAVLAAIQGNAAHEVFQSFTPTSADRVDSIVGFGRDDQASIHVGYYGKVTTGAGVFRGQAVTNASTVVFAAATGTTTNPQLLHWTASGTQLSLDKYEAGAKAAILAPTAYDPTVGGTETYLPNQYAWGYRPASTPTGFSLGVGSILAIRPGVMTTIQREAWLAALAYRHDSLRTLIQ